MILQQMEQKHTQLETKLWTASNEINQLKEKNFLYCSQIRRLNKRIKSSEREAERALSALHKWGKVARSHNKLG